MTRIKADVTVQLKVDVDATDEEVAQAKRDLGRRNATDEEAHMEVVMKRVTQILRGQHARFPGGQVPEDHGIQVQDMSAERTG